MATFTKTHMSLSYLTPRTRLITRIVAVLLLLELPAHAIAATSTFGPTVLVNTESFQTIDEGDSTTNIEVRFGNTLKEKIIYDRTNLRFQFSRGIYVGGNITATGSLSVKRVMSGESLRVDKNADIWGNLGVSGSTTLKGATTINGNLKVRGGLSGTTLRVDKNADIWGNLSATGSIITKSTLTINGDNDTNDATLNFGNQTMTTAALKFENALQQFSFNAKLSVKGNLSGSSLRVDQNADIWGNLGVSGSSIIKGSETVNGSSKVRGNLSGASLRVDKNADIWGKLAVSGATIVRGNLSGASLDVSRSAIFRGNVSASGSIKTRSFLSGSTLTVDGNVILRGQEYTFPANRGVNGQALTTDGAGLLTWTTISSSGGGSGSVVFHDPAYPNVTYFGSGTTAIAGKVGTMSADLDIPNKRNFYRWQSTKTTNQAYWVSTRVRVPSNYNGWQTTAPMQFAYRSSGGFLNVHMYDTAGVAVPLTGASNLRCTSANCGIANPGWTTATITGIPGSGTFEKNGQITVLVQMVSSGSAVTDKNYADAGFMQFNFLSSTD